MTGGKASILVEAECMHYRAYGKTGRKVSLLGFGGMRFTENEDEGAAAMLRAYELGVNFFDTAPYYCKDRSLDIFGKALPRMNRDRILVSSKSGIGSDRNADDVRRRVSDMLERMNIDYLDVLHMWCIFSLEQYRDIITPGGPYDGAVKLKEEGLVRHLAFSAHAPTADIVTMCEEGRFEAAILSFNIINHEARLEGLRAARRTDLGLATMNPLGGGLLARLNTYFDSDQENYGEDFLATALQFVASHQEVNVILSGMKNPREVELNVKALEFLEEPGQEAVDAILKRLGGLGGNFCTLCRYCLPCPEDIDIPAFMAAYDLHKAGMQSAGRQQLGFRRSKKRTGACSECGECEEKCTQQLSIIERLKEIEGRFGKKY